MSAVTTETTSDDAKYRMNDTRMYRAAKEGDLDTVKQLITEAGMDDEDGYYLLEAAEHDQPHVVEYLIRQGANVNVNDGWLLCYAAGNGYLVLVKLLIEHGLDVDNYGETAMECAIDEGHLHVVKYLYSLGMRSCPDHPLRFAAEKSHWSVIKFLLSQGLCDNIDESVLEHAVQDGRMDVITLLHSRGIEPSEEKLYHLLQDATKRGRRNTVKILWKDGVMEYWMPEALLEEAIKYDRSKIVRFFVGEGKVKPDVDLLTTALRYGRKEIAEYLYDASYYDLPEDIENGKVRGFLREDRRNRTSIAEGMKALPVLSELIAWYY